MLRVPAVVAVALTLLAGCKEATGPVATEFLGTYQLESFNGSLLPYTLRNDSVKVEMTDGSITLHSDFGFDLTRSILTTSGGSVRESRADVDGRYRVSGGRITFDVRGYNNGLAGIVNDSTLTIEQEGDVIEYRRSGF